MHRIKATLVSAIAGAALIASAAVAIAAVAGEFGNYCAMGLTMGEKKLTDCSISQKIDGKTYCFGNNSAKEAFLKDPQANIAKAQAEFSK
jgi:YHS domain-containing protein